MQLVRRADRHRAAYRDYFDSTSDNTYGTIAPKVGKLVKVESSVSTTEYTGFDILGRVTAHKQTTDGQQYTTEYAYNLSGALIEQTYPSGRVVKNTIDPADGSLSQVQSKRSGETFRNYANGFNYNAAGAVTSMRLGNGLWETTQFNSRLQPTQVGLGQGSSTPNKLKLDYSFGTTANNGNVLSQTITVPGVTHPFVQAYAYDELNRLTTATETQNSVQTWKQAFTFDRYGNRNFNEAETTTLLKNCGSSPNFTVCAPDKKIVNPAIDTSNNRLEADDDYTFDSSGNTTEDAGGRTFVYDAENKQIEVLEGSVTIGEYFYDGDGRRVKKVVPGGETTIFVYDAGGKLIQEHSTVVQTGTSAKTAYTTNDSLGSPRINTDGVGAVISRHDYHPFGEEVSRSGYGSGTIRKQFTGYERDNEIEMDFAQARYFAYNHGRFTSPDPLTASANAFRPQSWNRYSYSYNNPLRFTDPSGMIAGDFYNLDGKRIGTDGVDDKKIHIVYDEKKAKEIEKTKGNYTGTVDAKITLPGVNIVTAVNEAVNRSDAATFDKSGLAPLEKNQTENGGGFREAGITWDTDGTVTVEPDGPYADPRIESAGMIVTPNTEGSAHVHPSGVITTTTRTTVLHEGVLTGATKVHTDFIQSGPTAPADYDHAAKGVNIVVGGSGNKRGVTFYNKNGDLATMSYKNFKKLGAR